jgi:hypothetical protein
MPEMQVDSRRCPAATKDGSPCRARVPAGRVFCPFHDAATAGAMQAGRGKGGTNRRRIRPAGEVVPVVRSVGDLVGVLSNELAGLVAVVGPGLGRARTVAYLCLSLAKCFEVGDLETRIVALEQAAAGGDNDAASSA